ncbi:MAG: tetratricopeptide repeat protein [Terriglobia bacterium]
MEQAIQAAQRCVEIDSNNLDFSYYLGYSYELAKQFDKAAEVYSAAMPRDEKNMDLRVGLARTRMNQGNELKALELAGQVLKQAPQNADALLVMGLSHWHQGNLTQARTYLEKGAALASDYTEFYVALGKIAEQENQKGKAKEAYSQALKLEPNNQEIAQRLQSLQEGVH